MWVMALQVNSRRANGIDASITRATWLEWLADINAIVTTLESNPHIVRPVWLGFTFHTLCLKSKLAAASSVACYCHT